MGFIKLDDGTIKEDQRKNGARIKLDLGDWIKIVSVVVVVILGFGNIKWTVNQHSQVLAETIQTVKINTGIIRDNCKDIEYLKQSFNKIDTKLDKLLNKK